MNGDIAFFAVPMAAVMGATIFVGLSTSWRTEVQSALQSEADPRRGSWLVSLVSLGPVGPLILGSMTIVTVALCSLDPLRAGAAVMAALAGYWIRYLLE